MAPTQRDSSRVAIDGAKVRRTRQLQGTDLTLLASRAGISQSYLSQIESGQRLRLGAALFAQLCDALEVTDRTTLMATPPTDP
jgi:transcriptional regulator with XRE-family HTH domain